MAPENVVVALKQLARIDGIKTPATILADGFKMFQVFVVVNLP